MFRCSSLETSHPHLLPQSPKFCSIHLCLFFCFAYRVIINTCTPMFIAALFITARTWKQPSCPSADEWIRKLWYIYTMEYYSAIKKNSFESGLMRWMKLEPIIHSEETRSERDTCTPMFITALFIIARTWKQPRCPSADEWKRKLWYIYTME